METVFAAGSQDILGQPACSEIVFVISARDVATLQECVRTRDPLGLPPGKILVGAENELLGRWVNLKAMRKMILCVVEEVRGIHGSYQTPIEVLLSWMTMMCAWSRTLGLLCL